MACNKVNFSCPRDYTIEVANHMDTDQTAEMHRLICVLVVYVKPGFVMTWLISLLTVKYRLNIL